MLMLNRKIFLILLILSSLVLVLFVLWTSFSFKDRGFRQGEFGDQHPKIRSFVDENMEIIDNFFVPLLMRFVGKNAKTSLAVNSSEILILKFYPIFI